MWAWFEKLITENNYHAWVLAVLTFGGSFVVLLVLRNLAAKAAGMLARKTATTVDDMIAGLIGSISAAVLFVASVWLGSLTLRVDADVQRVLNQAAIVAFIVQCAIWAGALITYGISYARRRRVDKEMENAAVLNAVGLLAKIIVWTVVLLLMLSNLGFNVTALLTGLGIGGIAVALALQNILSDLFASLSIIIDKPFIIGDFIVVDNYMGSIENIGLKTTRVRSLSGEQLIFSNADLLKSRIRNFKRMNERRISFTVNVRYGTPPTVLARIPGELRRILESKPQTRFDRAHFSRLDESALVFECVYYVTSPDYNLYMDTQQAVNLEIAEYFGKESISFAFPTRVVMMDGNAAAP